MQISIKNSNQLKAIAIMMMLCLHLFNRDYQGLFKPLIFIGKQPLSYYISLFGDACVPIFAFVSGLGLYFKYRQSPENFKKQNLQRIEKLYINYWIIIAIFVVILGLLLRHPEIPGSLQTFLFNVTAIDPSYNGAWWFFTVYVIFVLTSPFWFNLLDKLNPYFFLFALFIIYLVAFYFRIYRPGDYSNAFASWLHTKAALFFCTLFQFMLGAFALKYDWNHRISALFSRFKYRSLVGVLGIIILIIFHGIIPNFVVAPFTGLGFIFLFLQIKLPICVDKFLDFMAPRAMNFWLVHMFFYLIYFPDFIYSPQYTPLIYTLLVGVCLLSSFIIQAIERPINKLVFP